MKLLVFADIHITERPKWRFDLCKRILLDDIPKQMKFHDVDAIIFLGDMFEKNDRISNQERILVEAFANLVEDIPFYLLVANHDFGPQGWLVNTLTFLNSFKETYVIERPRKINDWFFLPYAYTFSAVRPAKILFCHHEVKGFIDYPSSEVEDLNDLPNEVKLVISGHIHKHIVHVEGDRTFVYCGAPYQRNFSDAGITPGFLIVDDETLEFKFIPVLDYVHHVKKQFFTRDDVIKFAQDWDDVRNVRFWFVFKDPLLMEETKRFFSQKYRFDFEPVYELVEQDKKVEDLKQETKNKEAILKEFLEMENCFPVDQYLKIGLDLVQGVDH